MPTVLVTGASGHVGVFTILEYIRNGYKVHTTIRDIAKKPEVLEMIVKTGSLSKEETERIVFFEADLNKDEKWDVAMDNCDVVCHVAYPFINGIPYEDLERAAVAGSLYLLKLAADSPTVKHFVFCSSFAAVGLSEYPKDFVITDEIFTDEDSPWIDGYMKSKVVVEKRMWEFINSKETNPSGLTFVSICPFGITGPLPVGYTKFVGLPKMLQMAKDGLFEEFPNFYMNVSDVRDLAKSFVKATEDRKVYGERFLLLSEEEFSGADVLNILTQKFPEETKNFPKKLGPVIMPPRTSSNKKARDLLAYVPVDPVQSLCDLFASVVANSK
jgi:nucleoside-diphosphate-sugar epimerase